MMPNNPLGKLRVAAGFRTAAMAAVRLDVTRIHILNVERGATGASAELKARMARNYNCTEEQISEAYRAARKSLLRRQTEAL